MTLSEAPALMVVAGASARRETEALLRVTARANDALTLEDIYEPALEAVLELLAVNRAAILLFDAGEVMRFKAWRGLSEGYRAAVEGHSPWRRDAQNPQAFCTPDVEEDPALAPFRELFRRERIRSLVFVPLVCRGELLGKFMAYAEHARTFSERELALAQAVATQVAQACARARLIEAERRARELAERGSDRMQRLLRITARLSNALRAEEVAEILIEEGTLTLGARTAGVWQLDDTKLTLLLQRGYSDAIVARCRELALEEPVPVAQAARSAEPLWLESYAAYADQFPQFAHETRDYPGRDDELSVAALPLSIRGRVIGAMGVAFTGARRFDEPERVFLTVLARHGAEALERARLYRESQAAERRSRFLAQVSAVLATSLDATTTLCTLADLVVPEIADLCLIELADDNGGTTLAAVQHIDANKAQLARQLRALYPPNPKRNNGVLQVMRTAAPELYVDITEAQLMQFAAGDGELARILRELAPKSAMIVPVRAHGQTYGALTFVSSDSSRRYGRADLATALQVGERAGVALHNASVYQQAVTAVRVRDDFLSVAGHELRTPLTALLLQAQSLVRSADESPEPERARQRAERLTRNAMRLSRLVDELLDVTRITSGRLQLSLESCDLKEVVSDVVQSAGEQIERSHATVQCDLPCSVRGLWDRHRIEQVTMNLLSNALKYGGAQPIRISLSELEGKAVLRVRDHGMGISSEDQSRIFGRFERAVSSRNFGGLGLGLWIARQIVEAHGGTIDVWSEQGKGAEFTVRLPLSGL